MGRKMPIFYNALMLTGVNLLLRLVSTSFQVFLSGRIGAAGVGLLQLVLSVGAMAMTAAIAGVRTATMYLTAEELGRKRPQNVTWVLSACFLYTLCFSGAVAALTVGASGWIAGNWIGDLGALGSLRLMAVFLPVTCMTGVMTGYFTAACRIATLAVVEVAEQLCAMLVTVTALYIWAGHDPGRACQAVVMGSCAGSTMTLVCLVYLRLREQPASGPRVPMARRLCQTALPLAVADDVKVGINTVENLMVPKRLALYTGDAMAQFGMVCGMVFPVLMFPAAILYALADLLIPELARCNAAGSRTRIRYLVRRSLRLALLYGAACGGLLCLLSERLCLWLYEDRTAGSYLRLFALLAPMLYCDAIMDAVNKGLGKQKITVRINIFTSILDLAGLFVLLPRYGMLGYFVSFMVSHAVNAVLSLGLLLRSAHLRLRWRQPGCIVLSAALSIGAAGMMPATMTRMAVFMAVFYASLSLLGIIDRGDWLWLLSLTGIRKKDRKNKK